MNEVKAEFILRNFEFIVLLASGCICKQTTKVLNLFNKQPDFTALQGAIHDLNKQRFLN